MTFQLRVGLHETKGEGWVGSLRWIMPDVLGEGDGMGKAVSEKAEEGSHFQWRERKNPSGSGSCQYILLGLSKYTFKHGRKPKYLLLNQSTRLKASLRNEVEKTCSRIQSILSSPDPRPLYVQKTQRPRHQAAYPLGPCVPITQALLPIKLGCPAP